jgi:DNA polymerase III epsilon subunit-like protein
MIIVFDTETNGLPKTWSASSRDVKNWPEIVQIAWQQFTPSGKKIAEHNYLIQNTNGFEMDKGAQKVHGITAEMMAKDGVDINYVLNIFCDALEITTDVVAHNINFDKKVIKAEMHRAGKDKALSEFERMNKLCTMMGSTKYCGIKGARGVKWPKLEELHQKLFNAPVENAHDALGDVTATAKCYFKLKELGVI